MFLQKIVAGVYGVNCYILGDEQTKKCAVLDPGGSLDEIIDIVENNEFKVDYIILTHGHGDHIGAVKELKQKTNAKILAHEDEKFILNSSKNNLTHMMGGAFEIEADEYLKDGQIVKIGNLELKIIHTPGHTPGCICIKVDDVLFTGDTLFAGSIGRTDLPGGDYDTILDSLDKLSNLDDNLKVLPGHGPASKISVEKSKNPYMQK
ncbi:MBL fold metallo-hydrolase [Tepidibacter thalassicus]|uniref:Glyoxylase, beta-lactamase superfamily II n=1 Tax=Tepidibacter thalassicus DSM 15285 TaxID=1123350 RepID=A0A1M5QJ70_9FIRM|nr:MBL fold metallo-hydrolase [Tepidibacter thalassicus]SHH14028.1 Glyoxylase, beta-lactamase superfamily II [Tepidibacter thalassicus DSM 15285]